MTLVELVTIIAIISVLALFSVGYLIEARKGANEGSAVAALKTLIKAEAQFHTFDSNRDGTGNYAGSLQELFDNGALIDQSFATGTLVSYEFTLQSSDAGQAWSCTAVPLSVNAGTRRFFVDTTGVIRFTLTGSPGPTSVPIGE
jgi:competence protein ComGC